MHREKQSTVRPAASANPAVQPAASTSLDHTAAIVQSELTFERTAAAGTGSYSCCHCHSTDLYAGHQTARRKSGRSRRVGLAVARVPLHVCRRFNSLMYGEKGVKNLKMARARVGAPAWPTRSHIRMQCKPRLLSATGSGRQHLHAREAATACLYFRTESRPAATSCPRSRLVSCSAGSGSMAPDDR